MQEFQLCLGQLSIDTGRESALDSMPGSTHKVLQQCKHTQHECMRQHLKGKCEGCLALIDGGQEASNVEGGRDLHQIHATQPADRVSCLHLHLQGCSPQLVADLLLGVLVFSTCIHAASTITAWNTTQCTHVG